MECVVSWGRVRLTGLGGGGGEGAGKMMLLLLLLWNVCRRQEC